MDVLMPQLGETVGEGTVTVWHKSVGESVAAGEPLFEVSTDKVDSEVPAASSGILSEILVAVGETVPVGTRLAVIGGGAAPGKQRGRPGPPRRDAAGRPLSPAVRRLIAEHGLDAAAISGGGADGRVTRRDVERHIADARADAAPTPESADAASVIPLSAMRKRIAAHMLRSKATSPHVLQAVEVDFHAVEAARGGHSYLPFVARALCRAIADFPHVNASIAGEDLIVHHRVHLGIAVDLGPGGLVAPVVRGAETMGVTALAEAIAAVAARARAGALAPDDLAGGTYTISNSGTFGTLITAPIINQPQVAILSTDGVRKRPVVVSGPAGDAIAIRPVGVLAQSFDHRAFDGAYSAGFLGRLREILEGTDWAAEADRPRPSDLDPKPASGPAGAEGLSP